MTLSTPPPSHKRKQVKKNKDPTKAINFDQIRETVRERLPDLFMEALEAYQLILSADDEEDHKKAQSRHNAAKTALTHIQQLIRLSDWAMHDKETNFEDSLEQILTSARQEMASQEDDLANLKMNCPSEDD